MPVNPDPKVVQYFYNSNTVQYRCAQTIELIVYQSISISQHAIIYVLYIPLMPGLIMICSSELKQHPKKTC